ncbi:MAG: PmoA family protein [Candidatus Brocadiia bacterium]
MDAHTLCLAALTCLVACAARSASAAGLDPKPVPRMQALPLPYDQVSFRRDGRELARYHFGPDLDRPFLYPIVGPAGRSLTRMGHPRDPESHGHHDSVWISHHDVGGTNFWTNRQGRVRHQRVDELVDGEHEAAIVSRNLWPSEAGQPLLAERRRIAVRPLPEGEWLLVVDMELAAAGDEDVVLGKTPFGFFAVRVAKTIGVHDGGGTIRNSEGGVNEKGVFWKRARWVDYAGLIAPDTLEGLSLFDHPSNPNHPTHFHVRDDGWMGASLTFEGPRTIAKGQALRLRYGLYVHAGVPPAEAIEKRWRQFAELPLAE